MSRKHNRRRSASPRVLAEAVEPRILFAYLQMTPIIGGANPFNGIDVGALSTPALGDVDGDGDLDAVVGEQAGTLVYFKNLGSVTSPAYVQQNGGTNPLNGIDIGSLPTPTLGDVDGDGDLDVLVGETSGTVLYFKNTGTATVPVFVQQTGAANPLNGVDVGNYSAPVLADVDGDGDLDGIVGADDGAVRYFKNTGSVVSPIYSEQTGGANPLNGFVTDDSTPTLGDVDGDGDLDALLGAADGALVHLKNTGSATASAYVQQTGAANLMSGFDVGTYSAPAVADMDGDGDLDAIVGAADGTLRYYRGDTMTLPIGSTNQTGAANPFNGIDVSDHSAPALGDLDGDGDLDAVVGTRDPSPLRYFRNTGTSTAPVYAEQTGPYVPLTGAGNPFNGINCDINSRLALGDVDDDGDLDLVEGRFDGSSQRYFRNTGTATAPVYVEQTGAANPFSSVFVGFSSTPTLGDVDGDGDLDALAGNTDGLLIYFKNTGTATSPVYVQQTGAANPWDTFAFGTRVAPALGDMDRDGDLDAVVGLIDGMLRYYKNTGTATAPVYVEQTGAANPLNNYDVGSIAKPELVDLDRDGDLDAIVGASNGTLFYFQSNRVPVVNSAISDQTFTGPGVQSYTVSADTFFDLESPVLSYSATLTSGAALPAWLSFNPATRQFSGNPLRLEASPLQIRVTVNDGQGGIAFDDFQLTLVNVGDPPVAGNDFYSVNQNTVLTANGVSPNPVGVLANDNDPEGFALSAGVVTLPAHGSVLMNLNGTFTYTPTAGYSGPDSFTYQAGNGVLVSNAATVSINVIDTVGPTVQQSQFLFNTAPQKLTVKFNENVSASLTAADFLVMHAVTTAPVPFTLSYDVPTNSATLTITGILGDDDYLLRVKAAGVTDATGNAMAADHDLPFFFLAGDADHDRDVDVNDLGVLASNWQQSPRTFSQGDFDYNGTVNVNDLGILASHWQQNLVPPAAPSMVSNARNSTERSLREAIFANPRLKNSSGLLGAINELS
jgi:hypothetical protein